MNAFFSEFVETAKSLAAMRGLVWELVCDDQGKVARESRWDLTALVGMMPPPTVYLGQLGVDAASFDKLNQIRLAHGQPQLRPRVMPREWRDLYQALVIDQLLIRKNKPGTALKVAQGIRQLAAAAGETPPWAITPDQVRQAYNAALQSGGSGKIAMNFQMTVKTVIDGQNLADTPLLSRFCLPFASAESAAAQQAVKSMRGRENAHYRTDRLRSTLAERKSASKLPEQRAFWEMVRIIFTETPQTLSDVVRFGVLKTLVIAALRIGEIVLLPRG